MQPVSNDPIRRIQVSRLGHPTAVACLVGQDVTGTLLYGVDLICCRLYE